MAADGANSVAAAVAGTAIATKLFFFQRPGLCRAFLFFWRGRNFGNRPQGRELTPVRCWRLATRMVHYGGGLESDADLRAQRNLAEAERGLSWRSCADGRITPSEISQNTPKRKPSAKAFFTRRSSPE